MKRAPVLKCASPIATHGRTQCSESRQTKSAVSSWTQREHTVDWWAEREFVIYWNLSFQIFPETEILSSSLPSSTRRRRRHRPWFCLLWSTYFYPLPPPPIEKMNQSVEGQNKSENSLNRMICSACETLGYSIIFGPTYILHLIDGAELSLVSEFFSVIGSSPVFTNWICKAGGRNQ